jgi:hypothetical protein
VGYRARTILLSVCESGVYLLSFAALLSPVQILRQVPTHTAELASESLRIITHVNK